MASLDDEIQVRWIINFLGASGIHQTVYAFRVVAQAPGDATAAEAFLAKVVLETRGVQVLVAQSVRPLRCLCSVDVGMLRSSICIGFLHLYFCACDYSHLAFERTQDVKTLSMCDRLR